MSAPEIGTPEQRAEAVNDAFLEIVAEVARVCFDSPDPTGTLGRLLRWARKERSFLASPAALPIDDLASARTAGVPLHAAATAPRNRSKQEN